MKFIKQYIIFNERGGHYDGSSQWNEDVKIATRFDSESEAESEILSNANNVYKPFYNSDIVVIYPIYCRVID